ncbi:UDP-2,4-diacetamido-2,4,6-trideoxy-beta-L-altropyranose hydrolase [Legionella oakridgensis]|uniref:UDP-2,4-diacetamido-2,4, 6-trideoxy-beta-L-altropyranose hydrolase n=1 Tax=Legionella oakridgensis TaxID=29423 RepID=UPI0003DE2EAA|nr:UDP-2,4-diacetamido-2,4,6-trideoxy-beta-L-altropyranose hydrolase [Legionella oakridgensis]ETO94523.1 pseudaminic acid biosynthesis-associated protein PseG [Legionella oakridgensis RV-2-2007]
MQVVIRTDSSRLIGSGHVMRCLVLADMLREAGHETVFLCRDLPGHCYPIIRERGYLYFLHAFSESQKEAYMAYLPNDNYSVWLGVSQEQDAHETINFVKDKSIDLMIVDMYGLDIVWEKSVKSLVKKLMVIDDLANRNHYCDVLLDHNYYCNAQERYQGLVPAFCQTFLGPSYALINPALQRIKQARAMFKKDNIVKIKTILVFLGGMDVKNYTDKVLKQLLQSKLNHCFIDVVLGKANFYNKTLLKRYSSQKNIRFHIQPAYYFDLLAKADLSINAGGVSALERLYVGLPSLVLCTAENQKQICMDLHTDNLATYIENLDLLSATINNASFNLAQMSNSRYLFASNGHSQLLKELTRESCNC